MCALVTVVQTCALPILTRRFVSVMVCIYLFRHCRERRTKTKKPAGISNEGQINGISLRSFLDREPHKCIQCGAAAQFLLCRSDGGAGFAGTIGRASCRENWWQTAMLSMVADK